MAEAPENQMTGARDNKMAVLSENQVPETRDVKMTARPDNDDTMDIIQKNTISNFNAWKNL